MSERVTYRLGEDGVAQIAMDDGKLNVMSLAMLQALGEAFDRAERDRATVVLSSARAGIFSAGFDLKVFAAGEVEASLAMVRAGAEIALRLMDFPYPVVGAAHGHAFPMGTFLLLTCDVRIGAEGSWRMGLNEVAIGIAPPGFAVALAQSRLHPAWLSRTVTTGEMFEPQDALTAGLLDKVVPLSSLDSTAASIAAGLAKLHQPSHRTAKRRLREAVMAAMRAAIDSELTLEAFRARPPSAVMLPGAN